MSHGRFWLWHEDDPPISRGIPMVRLGVAKWQLQYQFDIRGGEYSIEEEIAYWQRRGCVLTHDGIDLNVVRNVQAALNKLGHG